MRILVVDDDPLILRCVSRALKQHQIVAQDPTKALSTIEQDQEFDLVLCDLNLPTTLGKSFSDQLLAQAPNLKDRFAFCTGDTFSKQKTSKAFPVLKKPFGIHEIRSFVSQFAPTPQHNQAV